MGKVRGNKDLKPRRGSSGGGGGGGSRSRALEKDNILGKISADIGAISLGPPRTKILKRSGGGSSSASASSSSNFSANFASRIVNNSPQSKQKKKVTFCQNLIAEELKEGRGEGEDAKHEYFSKRTFHPSQVTRKRKLGGEGSLKMKARVASAVPDNEVLLSTSANLLRKIIKKGVKNKKIRLKAKKQSFQKKMELIKASKEELLKSKQRQQTVIVGDMHPMLESLPSVEETEDDKLQTELGSKLGDAGKNIPKKTQKFSVKKTQKAILDSLKFFEAAGVGKTAAGLSAN